MSRKLMTTEERERIRQKTAEIAPLLIRLGRSYVAAVRAPNMQENEHANQRFEDTLNSLVILCVESGFGD